MKPIVKQAKALKAKEIQDEGPWTLFWDMHSGGGQKEDFDKIYIQAPYDEAKTVFYNIFGHNPNRVTCTCCGEDYSIDEDPTLSEASGFHRNCNYDDKKNKYVEEPSKNSWKSDKYLTLAKYIEQDNVLVIPDSLIEDEWRKGDMPRQGYIWVDG
jgi:hypothetical protein